MHQATFRNPRRKDQPLLPQPESSVKWVKTNEALRLSGVQIRRAMHMPIVARMLIGANQRMIWCSFLVVRVHMMPKMTSTANDSRTVWVGVLDVVSLCNDRIGRY
jgi:hypothetical protein